MPLRSSYGHSTRHVSILCSCIEELLWTESKLIVIRPSGFLPRWKYSDLSPVRTWSSFSVLNSSTEPKENSRSLLYPTESNNLLNHELCPSATIPSTLSFPTAFNKRSSVLGISVINAGCNVTFIQKDTFPNGLAHFNPTLSSEFSKYAMPGWNGSIVQTKNLQQWRESMGHGRRTHMGHAHDHGHGHSEKLGGQGEKVLRWGLWTDILLTIGKGAAGYVSGSTAIIADAAHSASDIVLSGVALWTSKASKAPPDSVHPYGHGKIETVGALSISTLLLVTGGGIAWSALDSLQVLLPAMSAVQDTVLHTTADSIHHANTHGQVHEHGVMEHKHDFDMEHMGVALLAATVSIGAKEGLYWITKAAGEKAGSALLKANAWHHRSDAISSIVALIGVGGAMLGLPLLDPVAALFVSGMIVTAGLETGYQSMQELLDMGLPESVLAPIRKTVIEVDGVEGIHQVRGRRMGSTVHVDVHIEVDPWLSVSAAHNIGEAVRQRVRMRHPNVTESFVHIDPADGRSTTLDPSASGEIETEAADGRSHQHHYDEPSHGHKHSHVHHGYEYPDGHDHRHDDEHIRGQGHNHDHETSAKDEAGSKDEHLHNLRDLTNAGSKAELLNSSSEISKKGLEGLRDNFGTLQQSEVERVVRHVLDSNFRKTVKVRTVTCHFLQGKVVAEVGVSLDVNLSIRDAMQHANGIEACLLQNVEDLSAVSVQLNLSN